MEDRELICNGEFATHCDCYEVDGDYCCDCGAAPFDTDSDLDENDSKER